MISDGITQLAEATRGSLLGHIRFNEIVSDVLCEATKGDK